MSAADVFTAWSKSGLSSLTDGCSYQVYLKKVVGLEDPGSPATILGTAYHAALEHHERIRILNVRDRANLALPTLDELVERAADGLALDAAHMPPEVWERHETEPGELGAKLRTALTHWWEAPIRDGQRGAGSSLRDHLLTMRPVAVEPYFRVPYGGSPRPLHGYIDWLGWCYDDSCWVVVDHKSASSFGFWKHGGEGHELEAAAYVLGSEIAGNLPPASDVRQEWHISRTKEGSNSRFEPVRLVDYRWGGGEPDFLDGTMQLADQIVEQGLFEKNPNWNLCSPKWCAFHVANGGPCDPDE